MSEEQKYDWRYENSIINGKEPIEIDGQYSQYRTNAVLMNHVDTVLYANEMNNKICLTDKMHYDYLFYSIRKKKRFSPPLSAIEKKKRKEEQELISLISSFYKYNIVRSKEILLLTSEQINFIRKKQEKGGMK